MHIIILWVYKCLTEFATTSFNVSKDALTNRKNSSLNQGKHEQPFLIQEVGKVGVHPGFHESKNLDVYYYLNIWNIKKQLLNIGFHRSYTKNSEKKTSKKRMRKRMTLPLNHQDLKTDKTCTLDPTF